MPGDRPMPGERPNPGTVYPSMIGGGASLESCVVIVPSAPTVKDVPSLQSKSTLITFPAEPDAPVGQEQVPAFGHAASGAHPDVLDEVCVSSTPSMVGESGTPVWSTGIRTVSKVFTGHVELNETDRLQPLVVRPCETVSVLPATETTTLEKEKRTRDEESENQ